MLPTTAASSSEPPTSAFRGDVAVPGMAERLGPGARLGGFTIVRLIGTGGMGCVYEARQESLRRTVAVKVMARRSDSARRRFEFEAKVLASLRHPGIAQIFEVGVSEAAGGVPWFAMEYVANARPVTEAAAPLRVRERLGLFRQVCMAVAHGHQRGVIHRDLKPGNILVDGAGHARVIDFGVARTTDSDLAVTTMRTDVGQLVGTVQYMSPEQFDADPNDLDIRSDVYALGVILHELLAGRPPYDLRRTSVHEAARIVREEEPPRLAASGRDLPRDLDLIVRKAMAKDRAHRYGSALELAADVDRFLQGRAVSAREPGVWETLRWAARRHRAMAGGFVAALVVLAGSAGFMAHLRGLSVDAELAADAARLQAEANQQEAEHRGRLARAALDRLLPEMHVSAARHALAALGEGRLDTAEEELRTLRSIDPEGSQTRLDMRLLQSALHPRRRSWPLGAGGITSLTTDSQGRLLAAAAADGSVGVWRAEDGSRFTEIQRAASTVRAVALDGDGRTLATGSEDGGVLLWDLPSGVALGHMKGHAAPVRCLTFVPGRRALASAGADGRVHVWDLLTHAPAVTLPDQRSPVVAVATSPDGAWLATCTADRRVRLWDAARGSPRGELAGVEGSPCALSFSPDGSRLAVSGDSGKVQRWKLPDLAPDTSTDVGAAVRHVDWSGTAADSPLLAATGGGLRVVNDSATATSLPGLPVPAECVVAPRSRAWVAWAGADGVVYLQGSAASPTRIMPTTTSPPGAVAVASDGAVWTVETDGSIACVDAAGRQRRLPGTPATALAIDATATLAAVGRASGAIDVVDLGSGATRRTLEGHAGAVRALRLSPDGSRLASSGIDGSIRIWPLQGGEPSRLDGHQDTVLGIAFSPDGATLASLDVGRSLRLWNAASGAPLATLKSAPEAGPAMAFDALGLTLACSTRDGGLQLWDVATRKELGLVRPEAAGSRLEALSADAVYAAARGRDGSLRVAELGSGPG